jgi:hypothetical protein
MKKLSSLFVVCLFALSVAGQTEKDRTEWVATILGNSKDASVADKNRILKFNFAPHWTRLHDNDSVLGYIGDNYQRMRIVILTATKKAGQPDTYNVTGKSMVKNVVRAFSGTMKITRVVSSPESELEDDYKGEGLKEAGLVFGEYHFAEDTKLTNTGKFDGVFVTYWVVDKTGRLKYDEVMMGADGYSNNQFAGTWTSYKTKASKPASWGDSRIPVAGDLDIGAAEFSPEEKYINNGWQGYRDAYTRQNKRALSEERRQWWR